MSNEIKKWIFTYSDDRAEPYETCFIGTKEEFQEIHDQDQDCFGAIYTDVTECDPTDDELREYWDWH